MPLVPLATFLTGSLLSLLLPTLLLIALVVWYIRFISRAPSTADGTEPATPASDTATSASPNPAASTPGEAVPPPKQV